MAISESSNAPNLRVLDGVRCLTCLAIIMLHVHYALGALFFPSNSQCMKAIHGIPFISTLFPNVTFQMTMFWTMSGFLCEYQLCKLRGKAPGKITWNACGKFLLNRLLRLYPLYLLTVTSLFMSHGEELPEPQKIARCTRSQYLLSLLFMTGNTKSLLACVGQAWSVVMDIHGYLAIVLLSLLLSEKARRYSFVVWYSLSLVYMTYIDAHGPTEISRKELDKLFSFGFFSLEYAYPEELLYSLEGAGIDTRTLYPDIDYNCKHLVAAREARFYHYSNNYYTSIFKHASAMLLGSLLYINLKAREGKSQNRTMVILKLLAIPIVLLATGSRFHYTGIIAYLFLDVVLTLKPNSNHGVLGNVLLKCLSNRFWTFMAPYTYGIYMVHEFLIIRMVAPVFKARINKLVNGDQEGPCRDYNLTYIMSVTVRVWLMSWMLAFILHHTIEKPFNNLRKRVLPAVEAPPPKTKSS